MQKSPELEYIESIVHTGEISKELKELKTVLKGTEVPPDNVIEFFILEEDFPKLRDAMLKEKGNDTYPFIFNEKVDGKLHIIVFYNIKNVADIFEKIKNSGSSENIASILKTALNFKSGSAEQSISLFDD